MPSQVSFTLPGSEYQAEADRIARQKRMAEALQAQAFQDTPIQQGQFYSPLSGVAKMLRAYTGKRDLRKAEEEEKALAGRVQETRTADMSLLANALRGRQATPGGLTEDASGNVTQADPLPAQSPVESLSKALPMLRSPEMQQTALAGLQGAQQREEQRSFESAKAREAQAARLEERKLQIESAMELAKGNRELQERLAQQKMDLSRELAELRAQVNQDRSPYFQFLQTPTGFMAGNARTGQVTPVIHNGAPVVPAAIDPNTQRNLADAKAGGKETGTAQAQAQIDLPRVMDNANNSLQLIDQMVGSDDGKTKAHPGFQSAIGLRIPGLGLIPGTDTANFNTLLDQVKGGAFLEAFNSLKGGGQITEVEGKKATDAITRMSNAQSEKEFVKAAREYQSIIRMGVQRAKLKTGKPMNASAPAGVDPKVWEVMTPEERALFAQ
jgi:hypothetical protein